MNLTLSSTLNFDLNSGKKLSYLLPHKKLAVRADLVCLSMHLSGFSMKQSFGKITLEQVINNAQVLLSSIAKTGGNGRNRRKSGLSNPYRASQINDLKKMVYLSTIHHTSATYLVCFRPGSNWGPCAYDAHVMTTTLQKHAW